MHIIFVLLIDLYLLKIIFDLSYRYVYFPTLAYKIYLKRLADPKKTLCDSVCGLDSQTKSYISKSWELPEIELFNPSKLEFSSLLRAYAESVYNYISIYLIEQALGICTAYLKGKTVISGVPKNCSN